VTCSTCSGPLTPHCHTRHPTCTWLVCRTCKLTLDLASRRGYDQAGRRFRIT
jgi:hypothetical protein